MNKIKDELTTNHKKPEKIITGFMPENKVMNCPVCSFCIYLEHLKPTNNYYMWQTPFVTSTQQRKCGTVSTIWKKILFAV